MTASGVQDNACNPRERLSLDDASRAVIAMESAFALGHDPDLACAAAVRTFLARATPTDEAVSLVARLDALAARWRQRSEEVSAWRQRTWRQRPWQRRSSGERPWQRPWQSGERALARLAAEARERGRLAAEFGVDLAAGPDEIKRRLREASMQHHPDQGGDPAAMVRVNRLRELVARLPKEP